ncbi:MAG: hypothetical protein ACRDN9_14750, partial [Streptosporangiaceae bacterium]
YGYGQTPPARDPYSRDPPARDPPARDPYSRDPYSRDPYSRDPHGRAYLRAAYDRQGDPRAAPSPPATDTIWQTPAATWDIPGADPEDKEAGGRPRVKDRWWARAGGGPGRRRRDRGSWTGGGPRSGTRMGRRTVLAVLAVVALVIVVAGGGAGAYWLVSADDSGGTLAIHTQGTRVGGDVFPTGALGRGDGVSEPLNGVAAVGRTVVAVGNAQDGTVGHGLFLVSTDGGARWRLAHVEAKDGGQPPPWDFPDYVVGAKGAWLALSSTGYSSAVWTSDDGRTWTHLDGAGAKAFTPRDYVRGLARTPKGYVAVGYTSHGRGGAPVVWRSKDGRAWKRIGPKRLRLPRHSHIAGLQTVVSRGHVLLAKSVSDKSGKAAPLRSTNGGRTWKRVAMPKVTGSYDPVGTFAAAGKRFVAVVDGVAKKHFTSVSVVMSSPDGRHWKRAGTIHPPKGAKKYMSTQDVAAGKRRLAVLATVGDHAYAVFTSKDGRKWNRTSGVGSAKKTRLMGLAVTGGGAVAVGSTRGADTDPVAVRAKGGHAKAIDLSKVSGIPRTRHVLNAVASTKESSVAVGGAGSGAAIWASDSGRSWRRVRNAPSALAAPGGPHTKELLDVAHGDHGWVAAGIADDSGDETPLVLTSQDGTSWRSVGGRHAFAAHTQGKKRGPRRVAPQAVAYGPAGYIVVGYRSSKAGAAAAAVWSSRDLGKWRRGRGAGAHDLAGAKGVSRKMLDVTGGSFGYAAAGVTTRGIDASPALWTSKNGAGWTLRRVKAPRAADAGSLRQIAASGDTIVALGMATVTGKTHDPADDKAFPFASVSRDGGGTWTTKRLPKVKGNAYVTDLTTTQDGFVAVGVTGKAGRGDVVAWYSGDARSWRTVAPGRKGLSGPGEQQVNGVAAHGGHLIGVGYSADYRHDSPLLWHARLGP